MTDNKICVFCCKNKAFYRSSKDVIVDNKRNVQYYCAACANNAVSFGWLDPEELHKLIVPSCEHKRVSD